MFYQTIERINNDLPERFKIMVDDAIALIINRVQQEGLRADGSKFSNYSTNPLPAYYYSKVAQRKGVMAQLDKLEKENKSISYADFRKITGNRTDIKDFTMTGIMWASFHSFDVIENENKGVETYLGFSDSSVAERYRYNSQREGIDIGDLSEEEVELLSDSITEWIFENIKIDV